ncbi:DNA polymerase [Nostoc phage NMeng1]|nr:DNA polymerase [Nostoc phage NMeng1]
MTYLVFDLETTTKETHRRKANCFNPENWIVARGWKKFKDPKCSWEYYPTHNRTSRLRIDPDVKYVVGFNIKFDLMWEFAQGNKDLHAFFMRGGRIWDCQYAEYLLEGAVQESHMVALTDTAPKYGGTKKIDEVKLLWEQGVNTDEIPEDLLIDYLVGTEEEGRNAGDIGNTELVFRGQLKRANTEGMTKMIEDRMDGLLCTTYMEWFGIKVDVQAAARNLAELKTELAVATEELNGYIPELPFEFNWKSPVHKSALIFGGTVKYEVREPYKDDNGEWARKQEDATAYYLVDGTLTQESPTNETAARYKVNKSGANMGSYKTKTIKVPGELKVKWQDRTFALPGYTEPRPDWASSITDGAGKRIFSTGKDAMDVLLLREDVPFLKALGRKTALDKEIGTYYVTVDDKGNKKGMLVCVQPSDHVLHHKLNHTSTVTTRLSSNDPNLQNIPRGDKSKVKNMFVSRYGADGVMVEIDYSQLEVVVQGVLSGDKNLCQDLRDKIDFHCKRMSAKFGISYADALDWGKNDKHPDYANGKKERTKCKNFSFQRAYGAGAAAIAAATGMSVDEVKQLIEAEELLYPGVVDFNSKVEKAVTLSATPFQAPDANGVWRTYRRGEWRAPTGTRYRWRSHDAPDFLKKQGITDSFSPPELKNYPVQGTGGEFVQAVLGLLVRHFLQKNWYNGNAILINTVHDCVWVDCHKDVLDTVCADMKRIMESIPEFYNTRHGMSIDVPFPVEVEVGPNMLDLKHWHPGQPAWHHANAA